MSRSLRPVRLGLAAECSVLIVAALLILGAIAWAALSTVSSAGASIERIYEESVGNQEVSTHLVSRIDDAQELILRGWVASSRSAHASIARELTGVVLPDVELGIAQAAELGRSDPGETAIARELSARWGAFRTLWSDGEWRDGSAASHAARVALVVARLDLLDSAANRLVASQRQEVGRIRQHAARIENRRRLTVIEVVVVGLLVAVVVAAWFMRSVLLRLLRYSRFAAKIADGDYKQRLSPKGDDELDRLARTLNHVADTRQRELAYQRTQTEFTDSLQLAGDESEAHELLRRHLERSLPGVTVTVLRRDPTATRLEAVTQLPSGSPLRGALTNAAPDDCLALRSTANYSLEPTGKPLLVCKLCSRCSRPVRCTPLLAGGHVIGSVLVTALAPLDSASVRRVEDSVRQAAPVIANLRNLATARWTAATDALTGLANRRALDESLTRMVAQTRRNGSQLSMLMLDLDHFKRINDEFGHVAGDELLAAVGAALPTLLRRSDFAGRYGGEEFLILLPDTDLLGAKTIAEKLREALAELDAGNGVRVTASVGVAALRDQTEDGEHLQRAADRALYAAKTNGRNRVELAYAKAAAPAS